MDRHDKSIIKTFDKKYVFQDLKNTYAFLNFSMLET